MFFSILYLGSCYKKLGGNSMKDLEKYKDITKFGIELTFSNSHFDNFTSDNITYNNISIEDVNKLYVSIKGDYENIYKDDDTKKKKYIKIISDIIKRYSDTKDGSKMRFLDLIYAHYFDRWMEELKGLDIKTYKLAVSHSKDDLKGCYKLGKKQIEVICTPQKKENDIWKFNIDVDDNCIEIHADPLTYNGYSLLKKVFEEAIYSIADKLKLYKGYSGKGGGHISVDMATGFDNKPANIIKTILLYEANQEKIDSYYKYIDIFDDTNAPYYFDISRSAFKNTANLFKKNARENGTGMLEDMPIDFPSKTFDSNELLIFEQNFKKKKNENRHNLHKQAIRRWFNSTFATISDKPLTQWNTPSDWAYMLRRLSFALTDITAEQQNNTELKKLYSADTLITNDTITKRLHYQGINLQHTLDNKLNKRRVEFRRFVSQRNHAELLSAIKFLLKLILSAEELVILKDRVSINLQKYKLNSLMLCCMMTQSIKDDNRKDAESIRKKQ
jgi:hypothetical protein